MPGAQLSSAGRDGDTSTSKLLPREALFSPADGLLGQVQLLPEHAGESFLKAGSFSGVGI